MTTFPRRHVARIIRAIEKEHLAHRKTCQGAVDPIDTKFAGDIITFIDECHTCGTRITTEHNYGDNTCTVQRLTLQTAQ